MSERMRQGQERMRQMREASAKVGRPLPERRPVDPELGRRARANELEFLHRLHAAGGIIAPGTDVGAAPLQVPGFSFHRELALLVEGGLPNAEVLVAATRGAASILRCDEEIGTLEPGKRADVLVIDGDPLRDIHATRKLEHVVKDGRAFRPQALLDLIETHEAAR
jgi:imidazolonepropionase-like amidohydrolase